MKLRKELGPNGVGGQADNSIPNNSLTDLISAEKDKQGQQDHQKTPGSFIGGSNKFKINIIKNTNDESRKTFKLCTGDSTQYSTQQQL